MSAPVPLGLENAVGQRETPGQIFVMGTARSGTTWLANLLASHPEIVALTAPEHHGVHESHVFDHTRHALPSKMTRQDFVARYRAEDYYVLAIGIAPRLCNQLPEHGDAVEYFAAIMSAVAAACDATYWLEKTPKHAVYYDEISTRFPMAKFVLIERGRLATLASQMARYARPGASRALQITEKVFRYVSDRRSMTRLTKRCPNRTVTVRYEDLVTDQEVETDRILTFLGLAPTPLHNRFASNSSFARKEKGISYFAAWERLTIILATGLFSVIPFSILRRIRIGRDRAQARIFPKYTRLSAGGE